MAWAKMAEVAGKKIAVARIERKIAILAKPEHKRKVPYCNHESQPHLIAHHHTSCSVDGSCWYRSAACPGSGEPEASRTKLTIVPRQNIMRVIAWVTSVRNNNDYISSGSHDLALLARLHISRRARVGEPKKSSWRQVTTADISLRETYWILNEVLRASLSQCAGHKTD